MKHFYREEYQPAKRWWSNGRRYPNPEFRLSARCKKGERDMESAAVKEFISLEKLIDSNAVCLFNELIFITAQYRTYRDMTSDRSLHSRASRVKCEKKCFTFWKIDLWRVDKHGKRIRFESIQYSGWVCFIQSSKSFSILQKKLLGIVCKLRYMKLYI